MNLKLVKKQTVKQDGVKVYGIYLVDIDLKKYARILTFKDDKRGYALLETLAEYIGDVSVDDYIKNYVEK